MEFRTFIVSLPGSARRTKTARYLSNWPHRYEYFDAVDGRSKTSAELAESINEPAVTSRVGRRLLPSEVGCALSHMYLYEQLLMDTAAYYVVLEDDAAPVAAAAENIKFAIEHYKFDVLSLFSGCAVARVKDGCTLASTRAYRASFRADHTVGYVVTRGGAAKILSAIARRVCGLADWPFDIGCLDFYVTKDSLVRHMSAGSAISADRDKNRVSGIGGAACRAVYRSLITKCRQPINAFLEKELLPSLARHDLLPGYQLIQHDDTTLHDNL